ncbi:BCCT family transporter [Micromonospora sp. NPDC048063]|uniref:BCCT family transporter n=1 Tax=Micromonospora sp. NPDC048063 TaxID=3364256 RepID=UPI0037196F4D
MAVPATGTSTDSNTPLGEAPVQPGRRPGDVDRTVLGIAAAVSVLFVVWGIVATDNLASVTGAALDWVVRAFGWVFVLASAAFVVLSVWLASSRYGRIKLGRDDEKPEFSTVSWVAMMFSAGMGIGLMFWGAAEPLSHLGTPPRGLTEPNSQQAARVAMEYSFFHWALHPWAIYAVVGLTLAYFTFRKGRRGLISSAFFPLIGERANRGPGKAIDIFAIFATLFGSAVSLGLGALQINSGLTNLCGHGTRQVGRHVAEDQPSWLVIFENDVGLRVGIRGPATCLAVTDDPSGCRRRASDHVDVHALHVSVGLRERFAGDHGKRRLRFSVLGRQAGDGRIRLRNHAAACQATSVQRPRELTDEGEVRIGACDRHTQTPAGRRGCDRIGDGGKHLPLSGDRRKIMHNWPLPPGVPLWRVMKIPPGTQVWPPATWPARLPPLPAQAQRT